MLTLLIITKYAGLISAILLSLIFAGCFFSTRSDNKGNPSLSASLQGMLPKPKVGEHASKKERELLTVIEYCAREIVYHHMHSGYKADIPEAVKHNRHILFDSPAFIDAWKAVEGHVKSGSLFDVKEQYRILMCDKSTGDQRKYAKEALAHPLTPCKKLNTGVYCVVCNPYPEHNTRALG